MRQLEITGPGASNGVSARAGARGRRDGAGAAAGGGDVRPRRGVPLRRDPDRGAVPARPRVHRRGRRGRRRRARGRDRRRRRRAVPDLLRRRAPRARSGHTASCRTVPRGSAYGMQPLGGAWGGALADVLRVPFADAMLVALPAGTRSGGAGQRRRQRPDGYRAVAGPLARRPAPRCWSSAARRAASASTRRRARRRWVRRGSSSRTPIRRRLERAAALGAETIEVPMVTGARPGRRSSGASRSPSTPRATTPACTPRCARPRPTGSARASRSTSSRLTPVPLLEMYTRGCTLHTGRCPRARVIPEVLALSPTAGSTPRSSPARSWFDDAEPALADLPTKLVLVP